MGSMPRVVRFSGALQFFIPLQFLIALQFLIPFQFLILFIPCCLLPCFVIACHFLRLVRGAVGQTLESREAGNFLRQASFCDEGAIRTCLGAKKRKGRHGHLIARGDVARAPSSVTAPFTVFGSTMSSLSLAA